MIMSMCRTIYYDFYYYILRKKGIIIGKNCCINKTTSFGSEPYLIRIGNNVRISEGVKFITHDGGIIVCRNMGTVSKNSDKIGSITIGNNVSIGVNTIILPNVVVGDNVIIGAGSVVTKSISSNSVFAGVPAKFIESIDEYRSKNKDLLVMTKTMKKNRKKKFLINYFELKDEDKRRNYDNEQ